MIELLQLFSPSLPLLLSACDAFLEIALVGLAGFLVLFILGANNWPGKTGEQVTLDELMDL